MVLIGLRRKRLSVIAWVMISSILIFYNSTSLQTYFESSYLKDVPISKLPRSYNSIRPIIYTFFEPIPGGCCEMNETGHEELLISWKREWYDAGWEPRVSHPCLCYFFLKIFQIILDLKICRLERSF